MTAHPDLAAVDPARDHRAARALLEGRGWTLIGAGATRTSADRADDAPVFLDVTALEVHDS